MPQGGPLVRVKTQRDKHGGETLLLTHGGTDGAATTVIFAHRTIPGLRLARHPFDEETIRLLERTYPQLDFDWPKILRTAEASLLAGAPEAFVPQRPARSRVTGMSDDTGASRRRGQEGGRPPQVRDMRRSGSDSKGDDSQARGPEVDSVPPESVVPDFAPEVQVVAPPGVVRVALEPRFDPREREHRGAGPQAPAAPPPAPSVVDDDGDDDVGQEVEDETKEPAAEGPSPAFQRQTTPDALSAGSIADRHAALVQRIQLRVRDPKRQAALLAQAAALAPGLWSEPLDHEGAARFEQLHLAIRRQLPSRRRRARRRPPGPGGVAHGSPGPKDDRPTRPEGTGE